MCVEVVHGGFRGPDVTVLTPPPPPAEGAQRSCSSQDVPGLWKAEITRASGQVQSHRVSGVLHTLFPQTFRLLCEMFLRPGGGLGPDQTEPGIISVHSVRSLNYNVKPKQMKPWNKHMKLVQMFLTHSLFVSAGQRKTRKTGSR